MTKKFHLLFQNVLKTKLYYYLLIIIFVILIIFLKMDNSLNIKKINNLPQYSISGFETSYGVGVNHKGDIYIPDFKLGYIFVIKNSFKEKYVLNFENEKLKKVKFFNKFIFSKVFKIRGNFERIHDIYFDKDDNYIDSINKIQNRCDYVFLPVRNFSFNFLEDGKNLYFDKDDNMYVTDMGIGDNKGEGLLYIFDPNLNLLEKIGLNFHYKKGLISPVMSSYNKSKIFISEWGASKILIFNNEYKFLGWIGELDKITTQIKSDYWLKEKQILDINLNSPHAIKFDEYNNIYIVDSNNHRILKLSDNFEFQGFVGKYSQKVVESKWKRELQTTFSGDELGAFDTPVGLEIYNNYIYVADCFNNRIIKMNLDGEFIGILSFDKRKNKFF